MRQFRAGQHPLIEEQQQSSHPEQPPAGETPVREVSGDPHAEKGGEEVPVQTVLAHVLVIVQQLQHEQAAEAY